MAIALNACSQNKSSNTADKMENAGRSVKLYPMAKPNAYWKNMLSANAYDIMVNSGTEVPYKNPYWNNHKKGIYVSAATGKPLFSSEDRKSVV